MTTSPPINFRDLLIQETIRRLFSESYVRLQKCLELLSEAEIWQRSNPHLNSVGNLILHLCGNANQWIVSTLGKHPDLRIRSEEFKENQFFSKEVLLQKLERLEKDIRETLQTLSAEDLLKTYTVQCYEENGISILVHVVEHFSYHTGQISYAVKSMKMVDLGYYQGHELERTRK